MALVIVCEGVITFDNQGGPSCSTGFVEMQYLPYVQSVSELVDPLEAAAFVGSGFFILLPLWAAMYGGRVLINAIKF